MTALHEHAGHLLILGAPRTRERIGLFLLAAGCAGMGYALYALLQAEVLSWLWVLPGLALAAVGMHVMFCEEQMIFDNRVKMVFQRGAVTVRQSFPFDAIERVEWAAARGCRLALKDGRSVEIAESGEGAFEADAKRIAAFVGRPFQAAKPPEMKSKE